MGRDIILRIVDLGVSRVSSEDFESEKHDSTRRRSDGRENTIVAIGDVHRRLCYRFVVAAMEALQGHDPARALFAG